MIWHYHLYLCKDVSVIWISRQWLWLSELVGIFQRILALLCDLLLRLGLN